MPRRALGLAALLLLAALIPGPALAHSEFSAVRPFWSGVLHLLVSPLALAAILGLVAAFAASRSEAMLWLACLAASAALAGSRIGPLAPALVAVAGAVLTGLVAAAAWTPPRALAGFLALVAGAAVGRAAELDQPDWAASIGVGFATGYLALLGIAVLWNLEARPRLSAIVGIGRRVVGAWVAAIGLLLGTLLLKGIGSGV